MRKLIMKMSMSLDGFVADQNGKGDWIFKTGDEQSQAWSAELTRSAGLFIMGRKSFENMAPYWPTATGPFAAPMNETPKAVFTQKGFAGLPTSEGQPAMAASWANAQVFNGNLAETIKELKAQPGKPILAFGGATFMRSLIATGLIDEFYLPIHPVVLGAGMSIFTGVTIPLYLKLADVKTFPKGVVVHTYQPG